MALRGAGFAALLRAIAAQQVSAASARAIWGRLEEAAGGRVTARAVLALGPEGLRAAGLSRPKAGYALGIAGALASGRISLRRIARMPDEEAVAALSALKGVGRWTAEVWLLFAAGRPDIWPAADLALCIALQRTLGLDVRPTPAEAARLTKSGRPTAAPPRSCTGTSTAPRPPSPGHCGREPCAARPAASAASTAQPCQESMANR